MGPHLLAIGFAETDDVHRVVPVSDDGDVQPLSDVSRDHDALFAVSQSISATSSNGSPRSAMFLAFLAGSKVIRIYRYS
jgi:hypothetical protein